MSFRLVDLVLDIPALSLSEQSVLVAICRYADNDTHDCFPSRKTIAQVSRLQERQVQRLIPNLIDKAYIDRSVGKGRASSRYLVKVDYIKGLIRKGDIETPLQTKQNETPDNDSGDNKTPLPTTQDETLGLLRGDIDAIDGETFTPHRGDIDASYIGRIGYESVSKESVSVIGQEKPSARKEAKKFALSLMREVEQLSDEKLNELVHEIACRHPRSRMRNWTPRNVSQADTVAILDATMQDEAQLTGKTMAEVGRMMLALLDAWDDVPREKWQYVAHIQRFYKQGDYRLQPNELPGIDPQEGKKPHGTRNSARSTDGNAEALRAVLGTVPDAGGGDRSVPAASGGHAGAQVDAGSDQVVPRVAGGVPVDGSDPGVQQGDGGVQVLPSTRYPARIQWPRRNG